MALAVAAIPESLPVVVTLALAFGTRRMLERKSLVRSLPVVEIIGGAQVICTDKTGTITEGKMSHRILYWRGLSLEITGGASDTTGEFLNGGTATDQSENLALLAGGLCNNSRLDPEMGFQGDPTEVSLLVAAYKAKVNLSAYKWVHEIPFSSLRKMMSVVVERDSQRFVFSKGAPETLVERCTHIYTVAGISPLSAEDKNHIMEQNSVFASRGLRVLAIAYKENPPASDDNAEHGLVFLALAGLSDPPRKEVRPAIETARRAGIRVIMITGDNQMTAKAIANEVGLTGECMEGRQLDGLGEAELQDVVQRVNIFARSEPTHKQRILKALQDRGQIVVMTGDGVNDAPALKAADAGIAMGIRGTDVARDASDMILLDDNFATIVAAVEEGRRTYANVKKFVNYLLSGNLAEVLVVMVGAIAGYLPITAVQILWVNLVTDSGPAVALGVDPAPPGAMTQPPQRRNILSKAMLGSIAATSLVISAVILGTFALGLRFFDMDKARTMVFTAFVAQEFMRLWFIRHQGHLSALSNRWLLLAVTGAIISQIALIYTPVGRYFQVIPLGWLEWLIILSGVIITFIITPQVTRMVAKWSGNV